MKPILSILFSLIMYTAIGQTITSIHFEISSTILSDEYVHKLDSLMYYHVLKPNKKYSIIDYADNTGTESNNIHLSQQRANVVFKQLQYLGIDSQNITVLIGKGAIGTKGVSIANNRRVDIVADTGKIEKAVLVDVTSIKPGEKFKLDKLFFVGGMATLLPTSMPTLESLLQIMKENPKLKIRLEGHVHHQQQDFWDVYGNRLPRYKGLDDSMQKLSEDRAYAVYKYLIDNGIKKERLQWKGFSYSMFHESPQNNRRVEVRILSK